MAKAGYFLIPTLCVGMHLARSVTKHKVSVNSVALCS